MSPETKTGHVGRSKRRNQAIAFGIFRVLGFVVIAILFVIIGFIVIKGAGAISWEFLTGMPSEGGASGGIFPAIVGTLCLVAGSVLISFPIGVLSGIYINEYAHNNWVVRFIRIMNNNLSSIPSVVFGLFGMSLFVNTLEWGDSIIAGSFTLALLALPLVIRTTEEALKSIDDSFRQGSLALGATKLQTIRRVILPMAYPNIITGLILSIGRVSGETAPILFTVAASFLSHLPGSIFEPVMALPYHLYVISTSGTDIEASRTMAYGTALVLVAIVLVANLVANALRNFFGNKVKMN